MDHSTSKEFPLSSWAIDNRITIFLLSITITLGGLVAYMTIPKENFPEILFPVIYVSTPYPGTSAQDIENAVTRKIEKEIKGIEGIKKINSTSIQDYSMIFVEFETEVDIPEAKSDVKDAVDKAKSELPTDLPNDPEVIDINFSEIPVMFINLSGNFDNVTLKRYAEDLQDELEQMQEILRADIVGAREREIQVNVDLQKMENARMTLGDIESAIAVENIIISGGEIELERQTISVRVNSEFKDVRELEDIIIQSSKGNTVYLREIADVIDGFEDVASYARLDGKPVITISVIKKAGKNLVDASEKIKATVEEFQETRFPPSLDIIFSADQSLLTKNMLNELVNTIIMGFILVTLVLMFFMGIRDALFVGLAVPLSSFISFIALPALGYTMNLVVLFSFILAMGIVVDNAIVVIENTYRIYMEKGMNIVTAAKKAAGEVIGPVFAGTLTTICPFLPLLFWKGIVGEFMGFLPVVMIITLFASLFVAYIINPVFAVTFMRKPDPDAPLSHKRIWIYIGVILGLGLLFQLAGASALGNFTLFVAGFVVLYVYFLRHAVYFFQERLLPQLKDGYKQLISWSLEGWHSWAVIVGSIFLLIFSVMIFMGSNLNVVQFPEADPNFIYVYNEMPNGTDVEITDSITYILEDRVYDVIGKDNPLVKYVITNVSIGAGDANSFDQNTPQPHKSKLTIEFVPSKDRGDVSTWKILEEIREKTQGIPGTRITVDKEPTGPPGAAPIELTLTSEEFSDLTKVSEELIIYLDSVNIAGVEKLKLDLDEKRPQLLIDIDRDKARRLGISSQQIGNTLRTAVFGREAAQFRDNEDEYPIQVRAMKKYRNNIPKLLNMRITYMDQADGKLKSVPISAIAKFDYHSEYGGINRKDLEKSVTISSNILSDYNANAVNEEINFGSMSLSNRVENQIM